MTSEERCLKRKKVILVSFYGVELALLVAILVALFWRAMNPSFSSLDYIKRSIEATFLYDVNLIELNEICSNETRTAFTYEFLGIKKGCLCNSDLVVENKSCPQENTNQCNINKSFQEISNHELDIFPFSSMQPKKKLCGKFVRSFDFEAQIASDFGKCTNLQFRSCGRICWPVAMKCPITALKIIDSTTNLSSESYLINDNNSLVIERDTNTLSSPLNEIIISKLPFICISDEDTTRFEVQAQKNNAVNMACQQDILSVQTQNGSINGSIYLTTNSITIDDTQIQYLSHSMYNIFQKPLVIMAKNCYGETFSNLISLSSMSSTIQLVYIQSIVLTFVMAVIIVVFSVLHLMFKIKNTIFETALATSMVLIGGSQIVSFIFYRYYDIIIQNIQDKQCFGDNQQQINELISSALNELKIANTLSLINSCSPLILLTIHILINCFQSRSQRLPNSTPRIMLSQPSAEGNLNQQQLPIFDSGIISPHSVRKQAPSMSLFSSINFNDKTSLKK